MNLGIRHIEADLGSEPADTFHRDLHKDLKADFILANPPFNMKDWGGERLREDVRWKYGKPPAGNANFAWVQHFIHHLAPNGLAGFVLANGSMSSNSSGEGEIRKNITEANLVDCMVALPGQLFYSTQIPACLWFQDIFGQVFIPILRIGVLLLQERCPTFFEGVRNIFQEDQAEYNVFILSRIQMATQLIRCLEIKSRPILQLKILGFDAELVHEVSAMVFNGPYGTVEQLGYFFVAQPTDDQS